MIALLIDKAASTRKEDEKHAASVNLRAGSPPLPGSECIMQGTMHHQDGAFLASSLAHNAWFAQAPGRSSKEKLDRSG